MIQNRVTLGASVTKDSVLVFNEIAKRIETINEQVRYISEAAAQQNQAARMVNKSMTEIDKHSNSNAKTTERVSTTAVDLKNESQKLNSAVNDLKFLILGKGENPSDIEEAQV